MAWTEITRSKYERQSGRYASDVTDLEWELIASNLPPPKTTGRPRSTAMRDVVDAILYIASAGCAWRMLSLEDGLGQKNGQVYQWATKGSRPRQVADQRYESAYIFGAVCPALDKGAALVMPRANTEATLRRGVIIVMEIHPGAFMDRGSSVTEFRAMLDATGFTIVDHESQVIVARRR